MKHLTIFFRLYNSPYSYLDPDTFLFILKVLVFFLLHNENLCFGYSLEASRRLRGASLLLPQHRFTWDIRVVAVMVPKP